MKITPGCLHGETMPSLSRLFHKASSPPPSADTLGKAAVWCGCDTMSSRWGNARGREGGKKYFYYTAQRIVSLFSRKACIEAFQKVLLVVLLCLEEAQEVTVKTSVVVIHCQLSLGQQFNVSFKFLVHNKQKRARKRRKKERREKEKRAKEKPHPLGFQRFRASSKSWWPLKTRMSTAFISFTARFLSNSSRMRWRNCSLGKSNWYFSRIWSAMRASTRLIWDRTTAVSYRSFQGPITL